MIMNVQTLVAVMSWVLSPNVADVVRWPIEARETPQERLDRYADIAESVLEVVEEEEPLSPGPYGRLHSAAALLSITFHESRWQRDIDLGVGPAADIRRNKGQWCMGAINIGRGTTEEQWSGPDLLGDRSKCLKATLRAIRKSLGACRRQPRLQWLSAYASGTCALGHEASAARMKQMDAILYRITWQERQQ